jgi:hypothetical protein
MAEIEFLSQVPSRFALEKLYDVKLKDMTTADVDTKLEELETMDKENINTKLLTYFVKAYENQNKPKSGLTLENSKETFLAKCKEYFVDEYLQFLKDNFTKNYTDRDAEPTLDNHRTHFEKYAQEKVEQAMAKTSGAKTPGGKKRSIRRKKSIRKRKNARKSRRR